VEKIACNYDSAWRQCEKDFRTLQIIGEQFRKGTKKKNSAIPSNYYFKEQNA
jgi:hypothetical protein